MDQKSGQSIARCPWLQGSSQTVISGCSVTERLSWEEVASKLTGFSTSLAVGQRPSHIHVPQGAVDSHISPNDRLRDKRDMAKMTATVFLQRNLASKIPFFRAYFIHQKWFSMPPRKGRVSHGHVKHHSETSQWRINVDSPALCLPGE